MRGKSNVYYCREVQRKKKAQCGVAKEGDSAARPEPTQSPDKSATPVQPMDYDEAREIAPAAVGALIRSGEDARSLFHVVERVAATLDKPSRAVVELGIWLTHGMGTYRPATGWLMPRFGPIWLPHATNCTAIWRNWIACHSQTVKCFSGLSSTLHSLTRRRHKWGGTKDGLTGRASRRLDGKWEQDRVFLPYPCSIESSAGFRCGDPQWRRRP